MSIRTLGYVVVGSSKLDAWRDFGCNVLGLMASPAPDDAVTDALHFRMDDRPLRIRVEAAESEGLIACGWELSNAEEFEKSVAALEQAGSVIKRGSDELAASRCARGVASFDDPAGNPHELYFGTIYDHKPFVSPVGSQGFETGDLGLGHVVLPSLSLPECHTLFTKTLGFRTSDTLEGPVKLAFMRCNPRHHSLAFASFPHPAGIVHFMIEKKTFDDVGYAMDRALAGGHHLSATLGKHTNDQMLSFYVRTPSGFDVEVGCEGLLVDEATWTTGEITAPSFWGHKWDYSAGANTEDKV